MDKIQKVLTKTQVAKAAGVTVGYVERALVKGWLKGTKRPIPGRKSGERWEVTEVDFKAWREGKSHKITGTAEELSTVAAILKNKTPEERKAFAKEAGIA